MISNKFQPSLSSGMLIHVAIPSYELDKSLNFYRDVIGATPFRILDDRVTFGFHNLQLVCHLTNRNDNQPNSDFYPRHFGFTFIEHTEYRQFYESVLAQYGSFVYSGMSSRFSGRSDEHMTFILQDPSSNFVEFKHYLSPDSSF